MSVLLDLKDRFARALSGLADDVAPLLDLVRPSQDPKFGDYQANLAMPLSKRLGRPAREVAQQIVEQLDVADLCHPPEIAGPGFINLRLRDDCLTARLVNAMGDQRLGIAAAAVPRTYVIDYSAPNVAKPMHVGHIRSTVIGDSLCRLLRFLGHRVISDNHIGDWGTQFGMILYGYRHFADAAAYRADPVAELSRVYRVVRRLMDYHETRSLLDRGEPAAKLAKLETALAAAKTAAADADAKAAKHAAKTVRKLEEDRKEQLAHQASLEEQVARLQTDPALGPLAAAHASIGADVLAETAKLHAGDAENLRLWREFLPSCLEEIDHIYRRLGVTFDHTLGESFYHDRLGPLVGELLASGIATESDGAICVFVEGIAAPMIVQKKDGAFLYATTDLATLRYRMETWRPDAILYVVDHRQSLHFEQLFATARKIGYDKLELCHVSFGTVLGDDGKPFKTRAGDTVGLEGLLDEAVRRAAEIVAANDDAKPAGPEISPERRADIAQRVGIAALKYADLSQNRTSDYTFSYDKMVSLNGNTATYMQYAYARVCSIFAKGNVDIDSLRAAGGTILLSNPAERALAVELLRFSEALEMAAADYRPNYLTAYLFDLANRYSNFYEASPVLSADTPELRTSRLLLCDLTARTIRLGLDLLGIQVVEKM